MSNAQTFNKTIAEVEAYHGGIDADVTNSGVNDFTGANTHTGIETHSGAETHSGIETHSGAETHSGVEVFSAVPNVTCYGTAGGRGPSPLVWDDCNLLKIIMDPTYGWSYFNEFVDGGYVLATNQAATHLNRGVTGFTCTTGNTISQLIDEPTGVLALNGTTDNEDAGICICGGVNTAGQIDFLTTKQIWFEARIKALNITDSKFGIFCGFAEEGLCATTGIIAAGGTVADKDLVGFWKDEDDGDKFDTIYNTASGGGITELAADAVTIEADTYIKLGGHFDGTTLTLYANGVALDDTVAMAATNFPDGQEMAFYLTAMNMGGDTHEVAIDWVRIAAEF